MLRASSLYYAVLISAIGGLLCAGIILYSSSVKKIEVDSNRILSESIIFDNSIRYLLSSDEYLFENEALHQIGYPFLEHQSFQWGVYGLLKVRNKNGKEKNVLFGKTEVFDQCLYIPNHNNLVSFTGMTEINGDVKLPQGRVERANIMGKHFIGGDLVNGKLLKSSEQLPKTNPIESDFLVLGNQNEIAFEAQDVIFNSFSKQTEFINIDVIAADDLNYKGNIVLESKDSIYIGRNSVLDNVILKAPVIYVESGFTGTVQLFATTRITIEEAVHLKYPSSIVLTKSESRKEKYTITIGQESMIHGVIIGNEEKKDFRNELQISLSEKTLVNGCVYNTGSTEVKGKILGHLVSNKLHYNSSTSNYKNVLVDAVIDGRNLDTNLLLPDLFSSSKKPNRIISYLE